jgi:pimeloyl-ACP methyl ester carboxylesterase
MMMITKTTVKNGDVTLPITTTGEGQKLVFFNGAGSTQIIWKQVISQLKGQYMIVTFDLRGHGKASDSADYSFEAFMSDAEIVMDAVGSDKPIVIAWSLGADLALSYAGSHPRSLGGLVIIDGAVPISEPLVEDEAKMRRSLNNTATRFSMLLMRLTPYTYRLSGDAIADLTVDLDARRQTLLEVYTKVDCPITMVLATKTAGEETTEHAKRNNKIWRAGSEQLGMKYPSIPIKWLDSTHALPLKKPAELAQVIDDFAQHIKSCT